MKYCVLSVLLTLSISVFSTEVKFNEDEIELVDGGSSILKIKIDEKIHSQHNPSFDSGKIKYLNPTAHLYGECAIINYGNAMYDTDGSESEINLPGSTYIYEIKSAELKGIIEEFSTSEFTILNKTSEHHKPVKEALLISMSEGFVQKSYIAGANCSIKAELKIPDWELNSIVEKNGIAYAVLGSSNRVIVEIKNEKVVIFHEEKSQ